MLKYLVLTTFLVLSSINSFSQQGEVCLGNYSEDSLRVSITEVIEDPSINICGLKDAVIISYDLALNINGVVYEWQDLSAQALDQEKIELLQQVRNDLPKYNKLFLERVKYRNANDSIVDVKGLYLWLAQ